MFCSCEQNLQQPEMALRAREHFIWNLLALVVDFFQWPSFELVTPSPIDCFAVEVFLLMWCLFIIW